MLTLTPSAVATVSMLLQNPEVPDGGGLRLQEASAPTATRPSESLWSARRDPDELVPAATRGAVFLAREVAEILDECVLDADIEGENVAFTIHQQPLDGNRAG